MKAKLVLMGCGAVLAGGAAILLSGVLEPAKAVAVEREDPIVTTAGAPVPTIKVEADEGPRLPPEFDKKYPPNSSVSFSTRLYPKDFKSGIPCPGGGFLPLLNGVPHAPVISRSLSGEGPVPPVIGKRVDRDGYEWYEHADGSLTTSRWNDTVVNNEPVRSVITTHITPVGEQFGLTPPPGELPGGGKGSGGSGKNPPN